VKEVTLGAYEHQDLPFEKLVEELQPERSLSHSPLFQVMFILQHIAGQRLTIPGLIFEPLEIENRTVKYDLTLLMEETENGFIGSFEYNIDLFEAASITRMAGHFNSLLEGIAVNPDKRRSELRVMSGAERHQLWVGWNNTQAAYAVDRCMHHLFEAQAEKSPDATA